MWTNFCGRMTDRAQIMFPQEEGDIINQLWISSYLHIVTHPIWEKQRA
jgi:hypothetical protein